MRAKKHSSKAKLAVSVAVSNAVWTKTRLRDAGYVVPDTLCELCGEAEDTLHHRLWLCCAPCVMQARCAAATEAVMRDAVAAGPTSTFFQHALLPHPSDVAPGPAASGIQWWSHNWPDDCGVGPQLGGDVFADGHASRTGIDGMNRASWALVQLDHDGSDCAWVRGVVPACLPQAAQAAEFCAAAYAPKVCAWPSSLHDDCLNVVKEFSRPRETWGDERVAYAGCVRHALLSDPAGNLISVEEVKAHQDVEDIDIAVRESFLAWGNHRADYHAGLAESLHPSANAETSAHVAAELEKVRVVLAVISVVLPLWPFPIARHVRTAAAASKDRAPRVSFERAHRWFRGPRYWTCWTCRSRTRSSCLPAPRRAQACPGLSDHLARNAEVGMGHVLVEFRTASGAFTICSACGRYGSRYARGLASRCTGLTQTRRSAITWRRVFEKGQHPYTGVPFRSHADGALSVCASTSVRQTRDQVVSELRKHRLRGKTTPWASALLGVFAAPGVQAVGEAAVAAAENGEWDEDLVFGAIDVDGHEASASSAPPLPAAMQGAQQRQPRVPHAAVQEVQQHRPRVPHAPVLEEVGARDPAVPAHVSLSERLVYEWRERKRRRLEAAAGERRDDGV